VAQVSIPHSHIFGEVERPFFDDNEKIGEDVVVTQLYDITKKRFKMFLKKKLGNVKEDDILIFIHGYNVNFVTAVRQTAQLSYDLRFKGVPLTYSWTSQGELSQYPKDEASVMYTVFKNVVTIDASGVDTSFLGLGHSYFSQKEILVNDLRDLVYKSLPPQKRSHL
jgi:esterase/lipase superfamily enzyme